MARKVAEGLAGPLPVARRAELRSIRDADEVLDQALVIRFDPGASFSGEEVVELHLHGAPVVVRRVSLALRNAGVRQAEAGEFTRRAFLNGRMDLSEVEGCRSAGGGNRNAAATCVADSLGCVGPTC